MFIQADVIDTENKSRINIVRKTLEKLRKPGSCVVCELFTNVMENMSF